MPADNPTCAALAPLELEFEQSSQVFRQLLDAAPDAVVVVNAEGRMLFTNLQAERLFGYPRADLLGKSVDVLVPDQLQAGHVRHRAGFVATPHVRPMGSGLELYGRRRDGKDFPIEISLSPLTTAQGTLFSANIRDVTQRREDERALRRLQEHLLNAVESIQGAFGIFDAADRLVLCNSTYRHLMGTNLPGDIKGRGFGELLGASLQADTFQQNGSGSELSSRWAGYHMAPSGALDVQTSRGQHLRVFDRRTPEGGIVTTMFDVTDDVVHEEELRRSQVLAEKASSAKSEFLASMSHELRTPLNAVLGFAQLLQRDKKNPLSERQRERVNHVLRGGEYLLHLIDDVLDLARIEAGRVLVSPEPVDLEAVLSEVKETLQQLAARESIRVRVDSVPLEARWVIADRTRLEQILMNYGSNAIKYGRSHGNVLIFASATAAAVRITVDDDGIGVALDRQASLFQAFQRAGQETGPIEGTGIGLLISKRLAELMNGAVGFKSTAGQGSQFWLELPAPAAEQAAIAHALTAVPKPESALSGALGPRYVIVYVEDNPSNVAFMQDLIADFERVQLITAPTAELGIQLIRAHKPDVVIMEEQEGC
jgi:PAS domain S-box-containing protein